MHSHISLAFFFHPALTFQSTSSWYVGLVRGFGGSFVSVGILSLGVVRRGIVPRGIVFGCDVFVVFLVAGYFLVWLGISYR